MDPGSASEIMATLRMPHGFMCPGIWGCIHNAFIAQDDGVIEFHVWGLCLVHEVLTACMGSTKETGTQVAVTKSETWR